jgi:pyridoxine kinase
VAILSIQSHVAYGHVGNRAAVFPLERLGREVWPINTVQFSNHSGYPSHTGEVFTAAHLALVWSGVKSRDCIQDCEAVLSGYMGAAEVGHLILQAVDEVKAAHPGALYCCDPVMGDYESGFFVDESIVTFLKRHAVGAADIVIPNQFEAEVIAETAIASIDDAKKACELIHGLGPSIILITSFKPSDQADSSISMFLSSAKGSHVLTTPEFPLDPPLKGAGDLTAALFLGRYLETGDPVASLELVGDSVYSVFEKSSSDGKKELCIVESQEDIVHPRKRFKARKV